jgi:hypothetical protein
MPWSRTAAVGLAVSFAIYLSIFPSEHVESLAANGALSLVMLLSPFVAAACAARLWPRWWLVPVVFGVFAAIPIGVDEFERRTGLYPVGTDASTYGMGGMDYLTTSFLAWLAVPATAVAATVVIVFSSLRLGPN